MIDPVNTTQSDGDACAECGEDAILTANLKPHGEVRLCGPCHNDLTTLCPRCENRIWQSEGYRTCGTADLYCGPCNSEIETALMTAALLVDEGRDSFNERRR